MTKLIPRYQYGNSLIAGVEAKRNSFMNFSAPVMDTVHRGVKISNAAQKAQKVSKVPKIGTSSYQKYRDQQKTVDWQKRLAFESYLRPEDITGKWDDTTESAFFRFKQDHPRVDPTPFNTPYQNNFTRLPYYGSQDDARRLGYKSFVPDGSQQRYYVDYSVTPLDSNSVVQRADAQMKRYGITSEQTRDKSRISILGYNYLPNYGYDIERFFRNFASGQKVMDKGEVVQKHYQPLDYTQRLQKLLHMGVLGSNAPADKYRADLKNLYFGYPIKNGTIEVNTDYNTFTKGKPKYGYVFRFADKMPFKKEKVYFDQLSKDNPQVDIKDGAQMGNHSVKLSPDGKYKSYYDEWNIHPLSFISPKIFQNADWLGTGFELYDRQY